MLTRIRSLCQDKGITVYQLEKKLGFSIGTIGHWKDAMPKADKLLQVAEALDVSPEFLIYGATKKTASQTADGKEDAEFLNLYHRATPMVQTLVVKMLKEAESFGAAQDGDARD